jgi:hypothetical protein
VRRDHLDDLVDVERARQVRRRREVADAPVAACERFVGDVPDEVLQEDVLAVLGRARISLQPQHLFAHQRRKQRLDVHTRIGE